MDDASSFELPELSCPLQLASLGGKLCNTHMNSLFLRVDSLPDGQVTRPSTMHYRRNECNVYPPGEERAISYLLCTHLGSKKSDCRPPFSGFSELSLVAWKRYPVLMWKRVHSFKRWHSYGLNLYVCSRHNSQSRMHTTHLVSFTLVTGSTVSKAVMQLRSRTRLVSLTLVTLGITWVLYLQTCLVPSTM